MGGLKIKVDNLNFSSILLHMNEKLDPQNESHALAHQTPEEFGEWHGADDLADYNRNEADDYRNE